MAKVSSSIWKKILMKAAVFWVIILLANLVLIYFLGPQIWTRGAFLFGTEFKTTFLTLLFFEGAVILTLGIVWASGAMESRFDGANILTNVYNRNIQMQQRNEEIKQQNTVGKLLIIVGAPLLLTAILLFII